MNLSVETNGGSSREMSAMDTHRLNEDLAQAVDLFVMKNFKDCYDQCREVITSAKMEAEQERNDVIIEAAAALGIQALAEIDCWMETPAFIASVYGSVDLCPPRIIQVCILLHAHVREYQPCHSMVQAWLKNPKNLDLKQCGQVVRVYATHILTPTGSLDMVREIVDKCLALTHQEKSAIIEHSLSQMNVNESDGTMIRRNSGDILKYRHRGSAHFHHSELSSLLTSSSSSNANSETDTLDGSSGTTANDNPLSLSILDPLTHIQATAVEGFSKLCQFLTERYKFLRHPAVRLFCMGAFAVLALMHAQTGDVVSNLSRFVVMWRVFLQKVFDYLKPKSR